MTEGELRTRREGAPGVQPASAHRPPQAAAASPMSRQAEIPGVSAVIAVATPDGYAPKADVVASAPDSTRAQMNYGLALMEAGKWDQPLLKELSQAMMDASICGLGQAAPNPALTVMRYFPQEIEG